MLKISELFEDLGVNPHVFPIIMPLTIGIEIETPDDVIGFAWVSPNRDCMRIVTLADRDWENSQDYTGLTPTLYQGNVVQKISDHQFYEELINGPVVAFSGGMTGKSLNAVLSPLPVPKVITLGSALATAMAPKLYKMKKPPASADDLVKWLNKGAPLRLGSRKTILDNLGMTVDNRFSTPKMGWNLSVDLALWNHVLNSSAEDPPVDDLSPDA